MSWQSRLGFTSKLREVVKSHASHCDMINMLTAISNKMQSEVDQGFKQFSVSFISLLYPWPASSL